MAFFYRRFPPPETIIMSIIRKTFTTITSSISLLFAGLWLVIRIIAEYFGFISDGNDRATGIKDMREEYRKANWK